MSWDINLKIMSMKCQFDNNETLKICWADALSPWVRPPFTWRFLESPTWIYDRCSYTKRLMPAIKNQSDINRASMIVFRILPIDSHLMVKFGFGRNWRIKKKKDEMWDKTWLAWISGRKRKKPKSFRTKWGKTERTTGKLKNESRNRSHEIGEYFML